MKYESTAGADASVEVPNYAMHTLNIFALINKFCCMHCAGRIQITGKLKEWVMIDHNCC